MSKNDQKVTTQNVVSTPTNPQWVTDSSQDFVNKTQDLLGQDPTKFFAGPQSLNNSLFGIVGGLGQSGSDALTKAGSLLDQFTGAPANLAGPAGYNPAMMTSAQIGPTAFAHGKTAYGGIDNYLNPYQDQVVNNTVAEMERARELATNNNGQGALLSGQFGGSRQGVLDANTNRDFYSQVGNAVGQLNQQGFNTAAGLANEDADRAQQANITNVNAFNNQNLNQAQLEQQANINNQGANNGAWQFNAGNAQQANLFNAGQQDTALNRLLQGAGLYGDLGQFGIGALSSAGQTQQGIAQNQAQAPISVLGALTGDYGSLPLNLFNGRTTDSTTTEGTQSGTLSKIGNGLKIGSSVLQTILPFL